MILETEWCKWMNNINNYSHYEIGESLLTSLFTFFLIAYNLTHKSRVRMCWAICAIFSSLQLNAINIEENISHQKLPNCCVAKKLISHTFSVKFQVLRREFLRNQSVYWAQIFRDSLWKHPFLLAPRRWGRFARRNVCDSATERLWLEWILQNQVSARRLELNKIIFRQIAPTLYDLVVLKH